MVILILDGQVADAAVAVAAGLVAGRPRQGGVLGVEVGHVVEVVEVLVGDVQSAEEVRVVVQVGEDVRVVFQATHGWPVAQQGPQLQQGCVQVHAAPVVIVACVPGHQILASNSRIVRRFPRFLVLSMPRFHRPPYPLISGSLDRVHSNIKEKKHLHWRGLPSSFGGGFQSKSEKTRTLFVRRAVDSRISVIPRKTRKRQMDHEEARAISPGRYRVLDMSLHASPQIRNCPWPVAGGRGRAVPYYSQRRYTRPCATKYFFPTR